MAKRMKKQRTWRREGIKVREKVKGSGVWWVFVSLGGGKRVSQRGGTKDDAEKLANEIREARKDQAALVQLERSGIVVPSAQPAGTGITFAAYAARFLERNKPNDENPDSLKHSTWLDYGQCVSGRLSPALGDYALTAIRRRHVKDLEAKWRAEGVKANNIGKHVRVLSSILSEAAEDELIDANPLLNRGRRRRSKSKMAKAKEMHPLTREELDALLQTAEEHAIERRGETVRPFREWLPFLLTLADTGMRLGEAFALRWSDIDWRGGSIHIQWSFTKGALSRPKNGKTRHVEMSARLRAALRQLRTERFGRVVALTAAGQAALDAEAADKASGALVFPDTSGGHLDDHNVRRRVWKPLITAAELSHHRLHDLRHSYATLHLQAGSDPTWVSAQLGHHSVAFTLTQYVSRPKNDKRRFADALSAKWSRNDPAAPADAAEEVPPSGHPQSDSVPTQARAASSVG